MNAAPIKLKSREAPLLQVKGLKKHFAMSKPFLNRLLEGGEQQTVKAVDGLDLDIPRGQTLSLVGESGCGKSTVARLIMGLSSPSGGSILFDGADISRAPAGQPADIRRRMQMIFQDPYASLNPRWRVADIIAEPLRTYGMCASRQEQRREVDRLLEFVGLNAKDGDKFPHEFSGGQRQRISIARAISTKPEFLVCDEPTSALDVSVQAQILNLMREMQRELGLTYLFISHDLAVVNFMSDWIGVMYLGRLVEVSPAAELFANPQHPYTRLLLDTIPDLEMSKRDRQPAAGEVPNPINPPPGCHFRPRCALANERCQREAPVLRVYDGGVSASCHAVEEGRANEPITVQASAAQSLRAAV
ncbi:oligopeptide/dipeptide ABC transporter ATP-binding protein [Aminobacter lissarensis]|uniref:Oligopeptide/dipeptide ABC transporter ATP-binding protein n=1 Tax=Aminobacter carboxidus TaxID=376165 RepID=A0A8E2BC02_9HYPH|nr:ABC transporter ATP-binding protein [Aminobacter lissarensis]MBB6467091.1 oligopeptide/dipeptide ABC transporter ATP-binding protein [Aminobacter lissarensis]